MQTLILTLHIIVCFLLVILILLQSGKEGMGVIFGGGNSSVFGSTGAGGILAKLTTLMAIIFVITSLSYTYVTSSRPSTESTILNVKIEDMPRQATPGTKEDGKDMSAPANSAPQAKQPGEGAGNPDTSTTPPADKTENDSSIKDSPKAGNAATDTKPAQ